MENEQQDENLEEQEASVESEAEVAVDPNAGKLPLTPASEIDPSKPDSVIGKIIEGEVINVTHFGAFVKLSTGEEGLVHISEIANEYVTDINIYVAVGNTVRVKVLTRNAKKQLELSIKQTELKKEEPVMFLHKKTKNNDFEDKMSMFMKRSEEKQIDIRRNLKNKQGITKKRR